MIKVIHYYSSFIDCTEYLQEPFEVILPNPPPKFFFIKVYFKYTSNTPTYFSFIRFIYSYIKTRFPVRKPCYKVRILFLVISISFYRVARCFHYFVTPPPPAVSFFSFAPKKKAAAVASR